MPLYRHALLLGCTGMLRGAAISIARNSLMVTSVARRHSLESLDRDLASASVRHFMLALDWSDQERYLAGVVDHVRETDDPDLVVAWIHDDRVALSLVASLAAEAIACDFFHVIGSSREDPLDVAVRVQAELGELGPVRYRQIILGAQKAVGGTRWLTDSEICSGALEAISRGRPTFVVGDR